MDSEKSYAEILDSIRSITNMGRIEIELRLDVDTTQTPDLEAVLRDVSKLLRHSIPL
jgi:hypothetical protein